MERIKFWFRSFKLVPSVEIAHNMGLKHFTNVFGDGINHLNCRSLWSDKYNNSYRCSELLMEDLQIKYPALFK